MTSVRIPRYLRESCEQAATAERSRWLTELPDRIDAVTDRWRLSVGAPFDPGGQCSWVAPARTGDGRDVVVKVGWRHPEAEHEAAGLRCWNGAGTVHVYDDWTTDDTVALLLERCRPGRTLAESVAATEADEVIAGVLRRLWRVAPTPATFRPLSQMCEQWAAEFEHKRARAARTAAPGTLDTGLADEGVALFRALALEVTDTALLATDLHAENVLAAEREPWLAIDPKPYVGDPTYDALQHLINQDRLSIDPRALATRLAALLDLDADRLVRWLFARCVIESVEQPRLGAVAVGLAPAVG